MRSFHQDPKAVDKNTHDQIRCKKYMEETEKQFRSFMSKLEKTIAKSPCMERLTQLKDERLRDAKRSGVPPRLIDHDDLVNYCAIDIYKDRFATLTRNFRNRFSCDSFSADIRKRFSCEKKVNIWIETAEDQHYLEFIPTDIKLVGPDK